jgi:hypothetical protein
MVSSPSLVWPRHKTTRLPSHAYAYPHKSRRGDAAQNRHNARERSCAMGRRTEALRNFGVSVLLRVPMARAQASAACLPCRRPPRAGAALRPAHQPDLPTGAAPFRATARRTSPRAPLWPGQGEAPGLLRGHLNAPSSKSHARPCGRLAPLPAPVRSPRAIAGTPRSCPRPHTHCGEGVHLPTTSLSLRGTSQGA